MIRGLVEIKTDPAIDPLSWKTGSRRTGIPGTLLRLCACPSIDGKFVAAVTIRIGRRAHCPERHLQNAAGYGHHVH